MVFYIVAAIYALGAGIFFVWSSGEVQPWAQIQTGYVSQLDDLETKEQTADDKPKPESD